MGDENREEIERMGEDAGMDFVSQYPADPLTESTPWLAAAFEQDSENQGWKDGSFGIYASAAIKAAEMFR